MMAPIGTTLRSPQSIGGVNQYYADIVLSLALPALIITHLLVAPYTKVEESFNIQAVHDIVSLPIFSLFSPSSILAENFDHILFPGAVPRTFVGAGFLAFLAKPVIYLFELQNEVFWPQVVARGILGLLNAGALIRYQYGLSKSFGTDVGRWWVLLLGSQFHVIFYASRTLPNTFAFILSKSLNLLWGHSSLIIPATLAFCETLPRKGYEKFRHERSIYLFVLAGVIFRSEIAVLLFAQLIDLILRRRFRTIVINGLLSAILALGIFIPIDSYLWQKPTWPELEGIIFNVFQGKSAEWGTSPFWYYFVVILPKLLLNPVILLLVLVSAISSIFIHMDSSRATLKLIYPPVLFIAIYSLLPHKEARFIIYVVPPLTAAASISASSIWRNRYKTPIYRLASVLLALSIIGSFAVSTAMLLISSLNYPGGEALSQLHGFLRTHPDQLNTLKTNEISVHMDILSCMTGVTRFQQYKSWPGTEYLRNDTELVRKDGKQMKITYDKTEDEIELLLPAFWAQFDYALMEEPGKAIGAWEIIGTVYAYAGMGFLKPEYNGDWGDDLEE